MTEVKKIVKVKQRVREGENRKERKGYRSPVKEKQVQLKDVR